MNLWLQFVTLYLLPLLQVFIFSSFPFLFFGILLFFLSFLSAQYWMTLWLQFVALYWLLLHQVHSFLFCNSFIFSTCFFLSLFSRESSLSRVLNEFMTRFSSFTCCCSRYIFFFFYPFSICFPSSFISLASRLQLEKKDL